MIHICKHIVRRSVSPLRVVRTHPRVEKTRARADRKGTETEPHASYVRLSVCMHGRARMMWVSYKLHTVYKNVLPHRERDVFYDERLLVFLYSTLILASVRVV